MSGMGWKEGGQFLPAEEQQCAESSCRILGSSWAPHNPGVHLAGEVQTSWMTISVVASTHFVYLLILLSRTEPITPGFPTQKKYSVNEK